MRSFGWLIVLAFLSACGSEPVRDAVDLEPTAPTRKAIDRAHQRKIVAFGDSLTAGFGIGRDEAYPAVLQELVDRDGYPYEVINAGVSGETSAGGVRRLSWTLDEREVAVVILELGGNDGLRGLPPSEMKKNLNLIIDGVEERGIPVLLAGLSAGDDPKDPFIREFVDVYAELARERDVVFLQNFLEGVAGNDELNQRDGKHPNVKGARAVAANVWQTLRPMLEAQ